MELYFPGNGWTPAWPWEVVNEFFVLLSLCVWLFLYLLNCLYWNPFSLLLFWFISLLPSSCCGEWGSSWMVPHCQLGLSHDIFPSLAQDFSLIPVSLPRLDKKRSDASGSLKYSACLQIECTFLSLQPAGQFLDFSLGHTQFLDLEKEVLYLHREKREKQ